MVQRQGDSTGRRRASRWKQELHLRPGDEPVRIPGAARMLGYGGVLPFAAMALNQVMVGPLSADFALKVFVCYSAAILSFLGGIRWGAATNLQTAMGRELVIAVAPSLWAVMCLLAISVELSIWGLLSGFVLMGVVDARWPVPGIAQWMVSLRIRLTIAVVICHLVLVTVMAG